MPSNSGFYYLRNNDKTQYFLNSLLMSGKSIVNYLSIMAQFYCSSNFIMSTSGDLILKTDSHQQALVAVLSEHASLYGLRVKVLSRDEDDFPGGYHYHQKSGKYMRSFFSGEKQTVYLPHELDEEQRQQTAVPEAAWTMVSSLCRFAMRRSRSGNRC